MQHTSAASTSAAPSASPAHSGITAAVGGDATAIGTNTLATGEVTNKIQNVGGVTIDSGEAVFTAAASGPGASATANSGVAVTGEDILIEKTVNQPGVSSTGVVSDTSVTKYIAIDIPGWTPPNGPIVVDHTTNLPSAPLSGSLPSGNVAASSDTVDVSTSVHLVSLSNETFAGAHFSHVSTWALVAA